MAWFDFVTGAHHREVIALYERRLEVAAELATRERDRADREVEIRRELEQKLIAGIFEKPAQAEPRRVHRPPEEKTQTIEVPLELDDDVAIIRQAARETGSKNARIVANRAQRIRDTLARGGRVTQRKPLRMPLPQVQTLIEQTLKEAEQEAYAEANQAAKEARSAAS